jgi:hypothetical protein
LFGVLFGLLFWIIVICFYNSGLIYYVYHCLVETLWESNFIASFYMLYFTLCPFETKRGSIFCFGSGLYF